MAGETKRRQNVKGKIIAAGLVAVLAATQNVSARNLEDILKEKGVITEADYKEVNRSKPHKQFTMGLNEHVRNQPYLANGII